MLSTFYTFCIPRVPFFEVPKIREQKLLKIISTSFLYMNKNMRKKPIGLWSATAIGIGGMVGAGIFSILGTACQIGGNAVYISFIIAGILALFSAYSYSKLGVRYPSAGGPVEFLLKGLGDNTISGGFNILLWFGYVIAISLYARAFAEYAVTFFPGYPPILLNIFSTAIVLLFTFINFKGAKTMGESEFFIVLVKVGILIFFSIIGIFFINPQNLSVAKWPSFGNIFFATAVVFLAYEGFGLITNAAEDMDDPKKTLPRALYLSVLIVIALYVGVSLVVVGNLPIESIVKARDYALAEAAKPFLGVLGFKIIALAALFSTASAINATLYGGANISYILAKYGELPGIINRKEWRRGVEGLFLTSGFVIVISNLFDLSRIAMLGSASFLLIYTAVNVSHLKLRKETGAKLAPILLAIFGNLLVFTVLLYYLYLNYLPTLEFLILFIISSFLTEFTYRKLTQRQIETRNP